MPLVGLSDIRDGIEKELADFVSTRANALREIDAYLAPVANALSQYIVSGGKRFRPTFAYLGYLGAGGEPSQSALRACSALELVHACALIHDDVMDGSDSRRNMPAIHKRFESQHIESNFSGSAERFGVASAILLGDLALSWSDWLLDESGMSNQAITRANQVFQEMREELMVGQYLDVLEGALGKSNRERSLKIANLKSGKYSIERPLHFGAALAGADSAIFKTFSEYGLPLGQAFQLRDDLLGVFGDSKVTGKPSGDDIREGKRTVLIAMALASANPSSRDEIESALGNTNLSEVETTRIQVAIEESGARAECERLIDQLLDESLDSLKESYVAAEVKSLLEEIANLATKRSS